MIALSFCSLLVSVLARPRQGQFVQFLLGIIPGMVATLLLVARWVEPFLGNALGRALRPREHVVLTGRTKMKQNPVMQIGEEGGGFFIAA